MIGNAKLVGNKTHLPTTREDFLRGQVLRPRRLGAPPFAGQRSTPG
jgi:hypothetical protein